MTEKSGGYRTEGRRKALLYIAPLRTYWVPNSTEANLRSEAGPVGLYPLKLEQRLEEGHYDRFDESGLPVRSRGDGRGTYHNFTTVCSYALANRDRYLRTGDATCADAFLKCAKFVRASCQEFKNGGFVLRDAFRGTPSAMYQGEAMSVLVRAWLDSGDDEYRDAALRCVEPFAHDVTDGGVLARVEGSGQLWFEEVCRPPMRHILNGMIYSLWGLRDVALTTGDARAQSLLEQGLDSTERTLALFDTGFWSWYWISVKHANHPASIMYHNLHVVQLETLYTQSGRKVFWDYAAKFERYGNRALSRLRAGIALAISKRGMKAE